VTQVRLRLQQVTNADPQAMTRTLAQTVFEGKAVDLTETRDYGSLIAAGLGQEWSGVWPARCFGTRWSLNGLAAG
jgi:type VI secretion system protein ImpL